MDMKKILQAIDGASTQPVEGSNDMKKFLSVVTEGKTPHNVTLPVQMAMQHYDTPVKETVTNPVLNVSKDAKPSMIGKYFKKVEEEIQEAADRNKGRATQLAERVASKINETPIEPTDDPNDPTIYGHQKANPMSLKGRIQQARNQLKDLANMAESDDLATWEKITQLAKGGMFMGLEQNLEQIRHGIGELAAKRKKGGVQSRGIDRTIGESEGDPEGVPHLTKELLTHIVQQVGKEGAHAVVKSLTWGDGAAKELLHLIVNDLKDDIKQNDLSEDNDPCWKDYKMVGTKKKSGKTVPNCVPKEAVQKTGTAGQLRGKDKVDVKGTVLGSPEKSQKGLRNKLVGGGA